MTHVRGLRLHHYVGSYKTPLQQSLPFTLPPMLCSIFALQDTLVRHTVHT